MTRFKEPKDIQEALERGNQVLDELRETITQMAANKRKQKRLELLRSVIINGLIIATGLAVI